MSGAQTIPVDKIRTMPDALRGVDPESLEYVQLRESIRREGVIDGICVTPRTDNETGETYYLLVNGAQRVSISKDLGLPTIPANVTDGLTDAQVRRQQVIANLKRVKTKQSEYSKMLQQMLKDEPGMTLKDLGEMLSHSEEWIATRLKVNDLHPDVLPYLDGGMISLSNAVQLSKLPKDHQPEAIIEARESKVDEFAGWVQTKLNEIRESLRTGEDAVKVEKEWEPKAHLRKFSELKDAFSDATFLENFVAGVKTPLAAATKVLAWVISLDEASVAAQRDAYEARQREKEARSEEARVQRAEQSAKKSGLRAERDKQVAALIQEGASDEAVTAFLEKYNKENGLLPAKAAAATN